MDKHPWNLQLELGAYPNSITLLQVHQTNRASCQVSNALTPPSHHADRLTPRIGDVPNTTRSYARPPSRRRVGADMALTQGAVANAAQEQVLQTAPHLGT